MGTPLKPAEAAERLFPATQPDGAPRVEPLPPAANPSPSSSQFRRVFPRIPCRVLVDYVVDGKAYRDCIANISEGGAFIETCHPLRAGRPITLSFALFQDQAPLRVAGEVVWSDATGAGVKLQPNATIGQFCAKHGEQVDAAAESLDAEPAESPLAAAPAPQEAVHAAHHGISRNFAVIVAVIAVVVVVAAAGLVRYDTVTQIQALTTQIERSSQNLARLEAAVTRRTDSAHTMPAAPPAAAATTAKPPAQVPTSAPVGRSATATRAPSSEPVAPPSPTATQGSQSPNQPASEETVYVVQQGDTLFRIGMKFNLSTKAILDLNQLASADVIYVGQRIRIPASSIR